jgi:uncharacterized protein DUF6235
MNTPREPVGSISRPRFRLHSGMELLESWSATAGQAAKNAVYKALFSVADGSVFRAYKTLEDYQRLQEFFIVLNENLVLKIRVHHFEAFGIVYIGPLDGAPGLDLGIDRAA